MRAVPVLILALLLSGCGHSAESADSADASKPVAQVETALAVPGGAADSVTAYGVVEQGAGSEHALATQAEGTLTRIVAPTGTTVAAGQTVAILTPSANTRLDLGKAASDRQSTADTLAREMRLRHDGLASDADVNSARAAFKSASQALMAAQRRGGTLVLRAPVSGTVQGLTAKTGDLITAGTTVATIGTRAALRAHFGVDPSVAVRVRPGQPISISAINASSSTPTSVVGVDPQVDPATHLASVYAAVPTGQNVGPGQPIRGSIAVTGALPGVLIPYSALMDDGGQSYVFVVEKNVAKKRNVRPGNSSGDTVQILNGLQPNERVVIQGATALEDGMAVADARPIAAKRATR